VADTGKMMRAAHTNRLTVLRNQLRRSSTAFQAVHHDAFEVLSVDHVNEYDADAILYRHKQTGAELLSIAKDGSCPSCACVSERGGHLTLAAVPFGLFAPLATSSGPSLDLFFPPPLLGLLHAAFLFFC
jgi:hypothetical protein